MDRRSRGTRRRAELGRRRGYPLRFIVSARTLVDVVRRGPPEHNGPMVIGDDYVLPPSWTGNAIIDLDALEHLDGAEELFVEAWDQS